MEILHKNQMCINVFILIFFLWLCCTSVFKSLCEKSFEKMLQLNVTLVATSAKAEVVGVG